MSLFIVPTSSFEHQAHNPTSRPSYGHQLFNDFQSSFSSNSQLPHFFDLGRTVNPSYSSQYQQVLAQAHLQAQIEAQRKAELARIRREELERAYFEQVRLIQAQQIEAQRLHRQEQEEMKLYEQFVEHQRRVAQAEQVRKLRLQQRAQSERQRRLQQQRLQHQQRLEQSKLGSTSQDPLLLALQELFSGSIFSYDSFKEVESFKGKEPVRGQTEDSPSKSSSCDLVPTPEVAQSKPAEPVVTSPSSNVDSLPTSTRQLVFTHPFGSEDTSSIPTDQISISVDEKSGTVQVSGLWETEQEDLSHPLSRPSSPTFSQHSSASSTASKKLKAHVSDVDENGNEIEVEVGDVRMDLDEEKEKDGKTSNRTVTASTTRSFKLPEGFKAENLKAEIQDDGLKIYLE